MMRTASRLAYLLMIALAVQAAGAERVRALVPGVLATATAEDAWGAPAAVTQATVVATNGRAPLPFVRVDESTTTEVQTQARPVRTPRENHRTEADSSAGGRNAQAMTRARAQALAYLDYSLALHQRRAGIPTNHTTAPPSHNS